CKSCRYHPKQRTGEDVCPFNFFYWDFLARHREILKSQGRMNFILKNLDKMPEDEQESIRQEAANWYRQNQIQMV
ncbi:MAG: cryptochrome/photolyase family protein, partial [Leptolyngbyaceae cyanobacterium]